MRTLVGVGFGLCVLLLAATARADSFLITNGGFESGVLTPWVATSSGGSGGAFFENTGGTSPLNGFPTVGANSGTHYAVSDSFGPGTNSLSQSFTVPLGATADILSYDLFVSDWGPFFGGAPGTEAVRLLAGGVDPLFGPALAIFPIGGVTIVAGGVPDGYVPYTFDITSKVTPGLTYQIDFVETDSGAPINMGVDDVSILARTRTTDGVPEPGSLVLLSGGLAWVIRRYRHA